jgi:hypothetical protein
MLNGVKRAFVSKKSMALKMFKLVKNGGPALKEWCICVIDEEKQKG